MRIISINVNQFLQYEHWNEISKSMYLEKNKEVLSVLNKQKLYDYLNQNENDLIILHEVPSSLSTVVIKEFLIEANERFNVIYPQRIKANFITIAITKNLMWELDKEPYENQKLAGVFLNRFLPLKNNELYITGVHIPRIDGFANGKVIPENENANDFWEDIIKHFKQNERHILIGDFNVDSDGTRQKSNYYRLCERARDIAFEFNKQNINTFVGETRVDYAFVSSKIKAISFEIIDTKLSDHCAIALEIE